MSLYLNHFSHLTALNVYVIKQFRLLGLNQTPTAIIIILLWQSRSQRWWTLNAPWKTHSLASSYLLARTLMHILNNINYTPRKKVSYYNTCKNTWESCETSNHFHGSLAEKIQFYMSRNIGEKRQRQRILMIRVLKQSPEKRLAWKLASSTEMWRYLA